MSSICDRLFKWYIENLNVVSENKFSYLPHAIHLKHLNKGQNAQIWEYVIEHVRARSHVEKIKHVLRKKQIMDSLSGMPITNVGLEIAKNKASSSDGKRRYLEQTLSDVENRVLERKRELEIIEHDIEKLNEMYEVLLMFQEKCVDKCLINKKLHQILINILNEFKRFHKFMEPCDPFLIGEKDTKYYNSSGEESFNVHDLLDRMKLIFKTSLRNNSSILLDVKELQREFDQVFTFDNCIDIFPPIKAEVQKNLDIFENFDNQSLENSEQKETAQLIKEMKFIHIQESFESNMIQKKKKTLVKIKENISLSTYTNSGLSCLSTASYSSKSELFTKLSEIKGIAKGIKYLEATIKVQENEANKLFIQNTICKKECKDIQTMLSDTYRIFDSIHWLLLDGLKSFDFVSCQIDKVANFAEKVFLSIPMLKKDIENLKKTFCPDRQIMWAYCTKEKLMQPILEEIHLHPNINFARALCVDSSTSADAIVDCCLNSNNKQESDSSEFDKYKIVTNMEYSLIQDLFLPKLQHYIDQMKSEVRETKETVKVCEVSCTEFHIALNNWWDQGAQFIVNIRHENKSLGTWLNIIKVLL